MQEKERKRLRPQECDILFSDIDGTLLNGHHQIGERTKQKLRELDKRGIPLVLVSARMPDSVRLVQRELGCFRPMICYGGALVLDEEQKGLYSRRIDLALAAEIWETLRERWPELSRHAYGGERWVTDDAQNSWAVREARIVRGRMETAGLREAFAGEGGVHKLLLMGEAETMREVGRFLRGRYPQLSVLKSNANYIEVMEGSVEKAAAARLLCEYYGIGLCRAAAFGDGENDIKMLEAAGYGFAMGNAPEQVRRAARFVTAGNDEEGIWEAIRGM